MESSDNTNHDGADVSFSYNLSCLKGRKIALLIKISKLKIEVRQENRERTAQPSLILKTKHWQLTQQYQIMHYVINESIIQSHAQNKSGDKENAQMNKVVNLGAQQAYINALMAQKLIHLRRKFFPVLHKFYDYILGHKKIKKSKYLIQNTKLKKHIGVLNQDINSSPQIFKKSTFYLSIIITCELYIGCYLIFQQKFRKNKCSTLFDMYEKTSNLPQFQQIYGKTNFSSKQCMPQQFQDQQSHHTNNYDKQDIQMMVRSADYSLQLPRNQMLYNFFKNNLKKSNYVANKNYFHYFWLMFDDLGCCMVQIRSIGNQTNLQVLIKQLGELQQCLKKNLKMNVDYGLLGVYENQKDRTCEIKGIICLGSRPYEEFIALMSTQKNKQFYNFSKIDTKVKNQQMKIQIIWQNSEENASYQNITLRYITFIQ